MAGGGCGLGSEAAEGPYLVSVAELGNRLKAFLTWTAVGAGSAGDFLCPDELRF